MALSLAQRDPEPVLGVLAAKIHVPFLPDALGVPDRGVSDDRFANRWLADPPDPADPRGLADRRRRHRDG